MDKEGFFRLHGSPQGRLCRASPLWQLLTAVRNVLRCGDLASGFLRFHCPDCGHERLLSFTIELFRHRFLQALRDGKHISPKKLADPLSWKHSGFNIHDGGEKPVPAHDTKGRKRLAEYLLRHPFSLQKITWNPATTQTVIKGGALPPGAHAKGTRKPSPSTVRQSILGIQLSPTFGMRPTARPRYLCESKPSATTGSIPTKPAASNPSSPTASSAHRSLFPPISNLQSQISNPRFYSSRHHRSKAPVPCARSGATSFSKSGLPSVALGEGWGNRPSPMPMLQGSHEPDSDWFDQTQAWKAPEIQLDDGRILVLEFA